MTYPDLYFQEASGSGHHALLGWGLVHMPILPSQLGKGMPASAQGGRICIPHGPHCVTTGQPPSDDRGNYLHQDA